jgi:hypothetical protein
MLGHISAIGSWECTSVHLDHGNTSCDYWALHSQIPGRVCLHNDYSCHSSWKLSTQNSRDEDNTSVHSIMRVQFSALGSCMRMHFSNPSALPQSKCTELKCTLMIQVHWTALPWYKCTQVIQVYWSAHSWSKYKCMIQVHWSTLQWSNTHICTPYQVHFHDQSALKCPPMMQVHWNEVKVNWVHSHDLSALKCIPMIQAY